MDFSLKEFLGAIGPTASIVFAAWIFMGFLQQRYASAYDRYRALIAEVRSAEHSVARRSNLRDQVRLYRRRCELMRTATNVGLAAAILLIATLILGGAEVALGSSPWLNLAAAATAVLGLLLVMAGAVLVIIENSIIGRMLEGEMLDVPDLARDSDQQPGEITQLRR